MLQLTVSTDLHIMGKKFNESQWVPSTFSKFGCQFFFIYLVLCVCSAEERLIQVWNDMRVKVNDDNIHFWVNYNFKFEITTRSSSLGLHDLRRCIVAGRRGW